MASFEFLAIVLTVLSFTASLFYYANTIRNATKARQAQVYVQIWNQFNSSEFFMKYFDFLNQDWVDYDDWVEKYGKRRVTDTQKYATAISLGAYFEGVGVLLKNGFIDIDPVVDLLGNIILIYWNKLGPLMKEYRIRNNNPRAYLYAEYLYDQAKPIILKQHPELSP